MNLFLAGRLVVMVALVFFPVREAAGDDVNRAMERLIETQKTIQTQLIEMQQRMLENMKQRAAARGQSQGNSAQPGTSAQPTMPGFAGRAAVGAPAAPAGQVTSDDMMKALESGSIRAAAENQDLLTDPGGMDALIKSQGGPGAAIADALLNQLGLGSDFKQDALGLSSQIFQEMVDRTNGDPELMAREIERAKKNPEEFAKSWSPQSREKLRSLSGKVGSSGAKSEN